MNPSIKNCCQECKNPKVEPRSVRIHKLVDRDSFIMIQHLEQLFVKNANLNVKESEANLSIKIASGDLFRTIQYLERFIVERFCEHGIFKGAIRIE